MLKSSLWWKTSCRNLRRASSAGRLPPTWVRSRMRVSTAIVARRLPSWLDTYSEICLASSTSWPSMASRKAAWLTRIEE